MANETAVVVRDVNFEEHAMTPERIRSQVNLIQEVMRGVMKEGEHYGVIPGCGDKPSLLKSGAEKLSTTFRLAPSYNIEKTDLPNGHREYEVICTLTHINSGVEVGQGVGSCTTMESKYRYRKGEQKCPKCGKEAIIKGKKEYGGGWLCYQKKGGCGAKFQDGDPAIENQNMGRIEHDNPADYFNTVFKMAKKRAYVDAVITSTAASDFFTQDIEDMAEVIAPNNSPPAPSGSTSYPDNNTPPPAGGTTKNIEATRGERGKVRQKIRERFPDKDDQQDFYEWLKTLSNGVLTKSVADRFIKNPDGAFQLREKQLIEEASRPITINGDEKNEPDEAA